LEDYTKINVIKTGWGRQKNLSHLGGNRRLLHVINLVFIKYWALLDQIIYL
jgi:hypothetical protein